MTNDTAVRSDDMKSDLPSPELLRKLLRYEPETGKLFWLPRDREYFKTDRVYNAWTARFAGKEAFKALDGNGYRTSSLSGQTLYAHRVAWVIQTGEWPKHEIDHIDRDRSNNVWTNLRHATRSSNQANRPSKQNSSSKFVGVSWEKARNKWSAKLMKDGASIYLGLFVSEESAAIAYDEAAKRLHGEFANLNLPERNVA